MTMTDTRFPIGGDISESLVRVLSAHPSEGGGVEVQYALGALIQSVMLLEIEVLRLRGDEDAGQSWRTLDDPTPRPV